MATISELIVYPVKSCAGISVRSAILTRAGLALEAACDREWMVIDAAGRFLTQREYPRMALIVPSLRGHTLELRAPGMPLLEVAAGPAPAPAAPTLQVGIWDDSVAAADCGPASAAWFSQALGLPCRLVRFDAGARRLASAKWTGAVEAPTRFADAYPLLIAGTASLADVNEKLVAAGRAPIPMNRFRPNLVVDALAAFEEDYVASFCSGAVQLKPVKPCARCPVPSVDQASGMPGPDPLDLLQAYRRKAQVDDAVCFGMNAIVTAGAGQTLHVGQELEVNLNF